MKLIKLTHKNLDRPVFINPALVFSVCHSKTDNATHVVGVGAITPVAESVDEVVRLLSGQDAQGVVTNGNEKSN